MIFFEANNIPIAWDHSSIASDQLVCDIANDLANLVGTSYFGPNLLVFGSCMYWKTFLNTQSPSVNTLAYIFLLKLLATICCCAAMRTNAASHSSSMVSRSLISSSRFSCYVIKPYMAVGMLTSDSRTTSQPYTN